MAKAKKTAEKATGTGVALKNQFTQADIPNLLEKVRAEIKALKGDKDANVRITKSLGNFGKITDITNVDDLRGAYAYITAKTEKVESYNPVFTTIDPSAKIGAFKEGGHTLAQWQDEIKAQYSSITFESKLKVLKQVKEELEKNLSAESKLAASLENIADLVNF